MANESTQSRVEVVGPLREVIDCHGNISSDYSLEQAKELGHALVSNFTVEAEETGCVCIDGRKCIEMADGSPPKKLAKIAGGNGLAVFVASELAKTEFNNSLSGDTAPARMEQLFNNMKNEMSEGVFGHSSTQADDVETNECGAAMSLLKALEILDTQRDQVSAVLGLAMGDSFNAASFNAVADNSRDLMDRLSKSGYKGTDLTDAIYETQGRDHVEKLESDDSPTHNHLERAVALDFRKGVTIDRDALNDNSDMPQVFSVDVDAIDERARRYASSDDEYDALLHAMLAMQVTTYSALCDGSHPVVVIK